MSLGPNMLKLAVLASHRGSNLQSVLDACENGKIACKIVMVISNNSSAMALERARKSGIPAYHMSAVTEGNDEFLDINLTRLMEEAGVELILTLGYMKKLGPRFVNRFRNRILNIHPSLLPAYGGLGMYGMKVHQAVMDSGEQFSGATVHLIDNDYDTGPIVAQKSLDIRTIDSAEDLAEQVLKLEHQLLVDTLGRIASREIELPV